MPKWPNLRQDSRYDNSIDYSNFTAAAVRIEANLPDTFAAYCASFFYSKCLTLECLTLKMKANITKYKIRNWEIRWRISISSIAHFCAGSQRFRRVNISSSWPWKFRSRARSTIFVMAYSMANIKLVLNGINCSAVAKQKDIYVSPLSLPEVHSANKILRDWMIRF